MSNPSLLASPSPAAETDRSISHWIDGAEYPSSSGRTASVFNPATGAVTAQVALADDAEIAAAIASARSGFAVWSQYSIAKRQAVLFAFRELLNARKDELARIITAEHGKVLSDAMGEILRGQEVVELATGFPHLIKGAFSENVSTGIDVYSIKQPLGIVGVISPFNFPAMVPMWFFPIAIAAGNAVILKPSEKNPSASLWMARLWKEAGLPDGVFTVLQGDKLAVDGLLESPTFSRSPSSARRRSRSTSMRRHPATANACRPSGAPRTTCSSCRMPTSTSSPIRRSTPDSAPPGSGAWRSRSSWRWSRSPTS